MDLDSIIIGAILIVICILPLVIMNRKGSKRAKQMKTNLAEIAVKNNCQLSKMATTSNIAIGLDKDKKSVFFYHKNGENEMEQYLDLAGVSVCRVKKSNHVEDTGSSLERLELVFNPKNKQENPTSFEFFNSDNEGQLNDELMLINEWEGEINQLIRT